MPWLTAAQHDEVVRLYTADRLQASRAALRRVADQALELQCQYSTRYHAPQAQLLALSLSAWASPALCC